MRLTPNVSANSCSNSLVPGGIAPENTIFTSRSYTLLATSGSDNFMPTPSLRLVFHTLANVIIPPVYIRRQQVYAGGRGCAARFSGNKTWVSPSAPPARHVG